ncbi:MAG: hypothetical protein AMXMBFR36_07980 [Acidobacteriota bacterium]
MNRTSKLALAAVALAASTGAPATASDWKWRVTPYVWATDVGVDVAIADRTVIDEEIPIGELLEDLETIAQVRLEAQRGAHGLFFDLFDVTLADEATELALPGGQGIALVTPEMGMTLLELGGLYDPHGDQQGLQLLYGARVLNQRAEIDAAFELVDGSSVDRSYEIDDTLVDALIGVRYVRPLGERWSFETKVDLSAGGTELTWSAAPSLGWSFGEQGRYTLRAGYRRMVVDFDAADAPADVDAEMTLSGFLVGLRVGF